MPEGGDRDNPKSLLSSVLVSSWSLPPYSLTSSPGSSLRRNALANNLPFPKWHLITGLRIASIAPGSLSRAPATGSQHLAFARILHSLLFTAYPCWSSLPNHKCCEGGNSISVVFLAPSTMPAESRQAMKPWSVPGSSYVNYWTIWVCLLLKNSFHATLFLETYLHWCAHPHQCWNRPLWL